MISGRRSSRIQPLRSIGELLQVRSGSLSGRRLDPADQPAELLGPAALSVAVPVRLRGHQDPRVRGLPDHLVVVEQPLEQALAGTQAGELDRHEMVWKTPHPRILMAAE